MRRKQLLSRRQIHKIAYSRLRLILKNLEAMIEAWGWKQLAEHALDEPDRINGPTSAQANLRLFGKHESEVIVTLYRDIHAWCPYCSKIWLWLEIKKIPYRIKKVTMRCYGQKEEWYLRKVPSGMLPALELNGHLITESDEILFALEKHFGTLGNPINTEQVSQLRQLERLLFRAWCIWLCSPGLNKRQQQQAKEQFRKIAQRFESALQEREGPFLFGYEPETADLIYIPYLERMNASLAYYKGYLLRQEHPVINLWFNALEELEVYRGIQGDFHTHAHDLPPQMGGCWSDNEPGISDIASKIDSGEGLGIYEANWPLDNQDEELMRKVALSRVLKHKDKILNANPSGKESFDYPLRAALTSLITKSSCNPGINCDSSLRYLRDRISVPRDMPLPAARLLRTTLEDTATLAGNKQGSPIPISNRLDQNPIHFR